MPYTLLKVTEQSGNSLTNYPLEIILNSSWSGWSANPTKDSIYVTDDAGNPLYYWIEVFDTTNKKLVIHVKIPSLPANSSINIRLYYAETNPYTSYHNGNQVFDFFDDFRTETALDTTKWDTWQTADSITFSTDGIKITKTSGVAGIISKNTFDFSVLKKIITVFRQDVAGSYDANVYVVPTVPTADPWGNVSDWIRKTQSSSVIIYKKVAGTITTLNSLSIDGSVFHRHKLRLKIASSGIIIWDVDYVNQYRNTAESLYTTALNYLLPLISSASGYTRSIIMQFIAVGQAVDPEPSVSIAYPPLTSSSINDTVTPPTITSASINDTVTPSSFLLSSPSVNDIVTPVLASPSISDIVTPSGLLLSSPAVNDIVTPSIITSPSVNDIVTPLLITSPSINDIVTVYPPIVLPPALIPKGIKYRDYRELVVGVDFALATFPEQYRKITLVATKEMLVYLYADEYDTINPPHVIKPDTPISFTTPIKIVKAKLTKPEFEGKLYIYVER
jgi:hypothetical protein